MTGDPTDVRPPDRTRVWWERAELSGPTLRLTPLRPTDAADYLAALGDPASADEVTAHLSTGPVRSVADAARIIATALADPHRIAYAQRLRTTDSTGGTVADTLIGTTSYYDIDPSLRALAIGHTWIGRRHWRSHVNTESKLLMLTHAFDALEAERVVWHTDIRNTRSQDAIARLGAVREGVLRHHRIRPDGSWRDTVQFSMLSAEWPAVRVRLEARLAARADQGPSAPTTTPVSSAGAP